LSEPKKQPPEAVGSAQNIFLQPAISLQTSQIPQISILIASPTTLATLNPERVTEKKLGEGH
jgi:hypothetical protein